MIPQIGMHFVTILDPCISTGEPRGEYPPFDLVVKALKPRLENVKEVPTKIKEVLINTVFMSPKQVFNTRLIVSQSPDPSFERSKKCS